jgi:hypothetical protein
MVKVEGIGGAFEEGRELDFKEPGELGFEKLGLLFRVGHRVLGRLISRWL